MYYEVEKRILYLISADDDYDAYNQASNDEGVKTEEYISIKDIRDIK